MFVCEVPCSTKVFKINSERKRFAGFLKKCVLRWSVTDLEIQRLLYHQKMGLTSNFFRDECYRDWLWRYGGTTAMQHDIKDSLVSVVSLVEICSRVVTPPTNYLEGGSFLLIALEDIEFQLPMLNFTTNIVLHRIYYKHNIIFSPIVIIRQNVDRCEKLQG